MTEVDDPSELPDDLDRELLDRLRVLHDRLDPPPPMLDDLVLFALGPARMDQEFARLVTEAETAVTVRGSARTRTLEFDSGGSSLLLTVVDLRDGQVRLDGWLAPAEEVDLELRTLSESVHVEQLRTDPTGRFVAKSVPRGLIQLVVLRDPPLITPAITL